VARENENRWMEISAEFSTDAERMEQWTSTARLSDSKSSGSRRFGWCDGALCLHNQVAMDD